MKTFDVTIHAFYQVQAETEEAAYYTAIDALKLDLPKNGAPLEADITEVDANGNKVRA